MSIELITRAKFNGEIMYSRNVGSLRKSALDRLDDGFKKTFVITLTEKCEHSRLTELLSFREMIHGSSDS